MCTRLHATGSQALTWLIQEGTLDGVADEAAHVLADPREPRGLGGRPRAEHHDVRAAVTHSAAEGDRLKHGGVYQAVAADLWSKQVEREEYQVRFCCNTAAPQNSPHQLAPSDAQGFAH